MYPAKAEDEILNNYTKDQIRVFTRIAKVVGISPYEVSKIEEDMSTVEKLKKYSELILIQINNIRLFQEEIDRYLCSVLERVTEKNYQESLEQTFFQLSRTSNIGSVFEETDE